LETPEAALATRLAEIRERLDFPPGVSLGILRLPILDGVIDELEALVASASDPDRPISGPVLEGEIGETVDLLTAPWMELVIHQPIRQVDRETFLLRRLPTGSP
jgi:hypothetical protein